MDETLEEIKGRLVEHLKDCSVSNLEDYLKKKQAEDTIEEILKEIKNPDFDRGKNWEEFVPAWMVTLWPKFKDSYKVLIYIMANRCKNIYELNSVNPLNCRGE